MKITKRPEYISLEFHDGTHIRVAFWEYVDSLMKVMLSTEELFNVYRIGEGGKQITEQDLKDVAALLTVATEAACKRAEEKST